MRADWWRLVTMCCLALAGNASPCRAAAADLNPVVAIKVENSEVLAAAKWARTQELVTNIYEQAGVTLRWTSDATTTADRTLTVVLMTSMVAAGHPGSDTMGHAPSPGDGTRGTVAYAFIDRVTSFASAHRLALTDLLACTIAHEIGHLLLPANAHRSDSIMRGAWHPALFPPAAPGLPGFPPDQAKLLRLRAGRPLGLRGDVR